MIKIRFLWIGILALLFIHAGLAQSPDSTLQLAVLIQEALQNNPQLQSANLQAEATATQIRQAKAWDAPQVGIEFFQTPIQSFPNPVKDGMETDYFIQQMIPFPGKISAMSKSAKFITAMNRQGAMALQKKIIRELKSAYYELYLVQRKIQINAENQDLLRKFTEIARQQYEVGMGSQVDILRAQTELSNLINEGLNLQQERKSVEAMINALLSRPVDQSLGYVPAPGADFPLLAFEQLKPLALENRPELQAMRSNIDMNRAELALVKREYYPDLMVRLMYKDMAMTSNDFWAAMAGVNIPLAFWSGGKYRGKVQEQKINLRKADEDYLAMENMVLFELQDVLVRVQTHRNLVQLYRYTVIPQAEQTLQSTTAAYQTGKTEFLMLIDAYRMVLMARLDYHEAVMNYMASQAALEQAVGLGTEEIVQCLQE